MLSVLASFPEFEREMTATRIAEARAYLDSPGSLPLSRITSTPVQWSMVTDFVTAAMRD
jgi:hypothetical protein